MTSSVVDPNKLNLDPDPGLDPIWIKVYPINFEEKKVLPVPVLFLREKNIFLSTGTAPIRYRVPV